VVDVTSIARMLARALEACLVTGPPELVLEGDSYRRQKPGSPRGKT
jgi:hypothetical protein